MHAYVEGRVVYSRRHGACWIASTSHPDNVRVDIVAVDLANMPDLAHMPPGAVVAFAGHMQRTEGSYRLHATHAWQDGRLIAQPEPM